MKMGRHVKRTSKMEVLEESFAPFDWTLRLQPNYAGLLTHPVFDALKKCLTTNCQAFIVGGWVRDLMLNRSSKDIDIVTVGSGIDLAQRLKEELGNGAVLAVYKQFGTAMVKYNDWEIEFVGARKESYRKNSRKPLVEDGSLEDDQNRRDFTINALSISLNEANYGDLIDPFNGVADLKSGIIKTPLEPERTFDDDPLRMMRAVRFAAQLGYEIAPETKTAISNMAERISIVSQERITIEFNKILEAPVPSIGLALLYESGLLEHFFPELKELGGVEEINGQRHKDNFYHTLEVVDNIARETNNIWLRYSALLHDIGKPKTKKLDPVQGFTFHAHEFVGSKMVPGIFRKLKLPMNEPMKYVKKLVSMSSRPTALTGSDVTDSGVRRLLFDAGNDIDDLMLLCEADITTKNERKMRRYLQNFRQVRAKLKEVEHKDEIRNFQPPISGKEIMNRYQLQPGRQIGALKSAVKDAILDGTIKNDYDEALAFLDEKAKELDLSNQ